MISRHATSIFFEIYNSMAIFTRLNSHIHLTIIPRARVGYERIDGQQGAQRRAGYKSSHIQQARVE